MTPLHVALTREPIDPEALRREVESPELGGVVVFCGEVRSRTGDKETSRLEYEAYESMALEQMKLIAAQCAGKYKAQVACEHRLGEMFPGDVAVVTAAACAHREQAFACCRELIDRIKEDVPIWKKEFGPGGEVWVSGEERVE
jgi:molybdopterin synthase catalytic subunit